MTTTTTTTTTTETTTTTTTTPQTTHIICVLDRSGSMGHLTSEVITNFNHFLKEQQELEGKAKLTLVIFDHDYEVVYDEVDIHKVTPLTSEVYFARGMTAMNDAIGRILNEKKDNSNAIVLIHTDGQENSSKEYNAVQIKDLVKTLKKKWEFIFVGAGMDAMTANQNYGFTHTLNANASAASYGNQYEMFSASTTSYRSNGMAGAAMRRTIVADANAAEK